MKCRKNYCVSISFHPEMALFPLTVVLRVFPSAAYFSVRLGENPCAAPAKNQRDFA